MDAGEDGADSVDREPAAGSGVRGGGGRLEGGLLSARTTHCRSASALSLGRVSNFLSHYTVILSPFIYFIRLPYPEEGLSKIKKKSNIKLIIK